MTYIQLSLFPNGETFPYAKTNLRSPKKIHQGLRKYFGITNPAGFTDGLIALFTGKAVIDIIKLDQWLKEKHGDDYPDDGMSMSDAIAKFYGEEANNWVANNI